MLDQGQPSVGPVDVDPVVEADVIPLSLRWQ